MVMVVCCVSRVLRHCGCRSGGDGFVKGAFVIVIGELILGGCCVIVVLILEGL